MTAEHVPSAGWQAVYAALDVNYKCVNDCGGRLRELRRGLYECCRCGVTIEESPGVVA